MSQKTIRIHHYDDEPQNISALRDNVLFLVMRMQPDWIRLDEVPAEDDESKPMIIRIHQPGGEVLIIEYLLYPDAAAFCSKADITQGDIVLLDAIERGPRGEPVEGVRECVAKARPLTSDDRIFLVSAFVADLPVDLTLQFKSDRIIKKPFDVNYVARELLLLLGISLE